MSIRLCAGICSGAAAAVLLCAGTLHAHAETVEDVYQAMRDVGTTEAMIRDAKTQYENAVHDEAGMALGGTYRTYGEWVTLIHENGVKYVVSVIAEEFLIDPQDIIDYYEITLPAEGGEPAYEPSVQPEKPFSEMTLEEKKAYIGQLPYEERVAFIATLSPADRKSIYNQLEPEKKADVAAGMADFGTDIGLHVSVGDTSGGNVEITVHDSDGRLIDVTSLGLSADATGWNLTVPLLLSAAACLLALGGILMIALCGRQKDTGKEHDTDG
ncbi:MAG: hypothetical protein IJ060_01200 [Oscillospiraceae bacterium]|nr:hypothetical protein [Oscillospiraceae bacterium]